MRTILVSLIVVASACFCSKSEAGGRLFWRLFQARTAVMQKRAKECATRAVELTEEVDARKQFQSKCQGGKCKKPLKSVIVK